MARFQIKRLISGGLVTNYHCPSRCRHCLYNCSPSRSEDFIDPDTAQAVFQTVRAMGCGSLHIGGGEPLLNPDGLARVLERMRRTGADLDYVETNGSWFRDASSATAMLRELRGQGLHTLLVSISPFHNERIPADRIAGALEAAGQAGVRVLPWVQDFWRDLRAFDPKRPHSLREYRERFGEDYPLRILRRYWIHFGGRALEAFRPYLPGKSPGEILAENPGCSRELMSTGHFHIDLYGSYIPGLCSGLAIGMRDLGHPLPERKHPLLTTLFERGVAGLLELAERDWGYAPQRTRYLNACDLCTEIRAFLVRSGYADSAELRPVEFYAPKNMAVHPEHCSGSDPTGS
jgi:hypothetical protein